MVVRGYDNNKCNVKLITIANVRRRNNMKYPKITKENFEEMTDKLVYDKKLKTDWERHKMLRVPTPKTRKDFFEMTKNMFGVGLGVTNNGLTDYEIDGDEDVYSELEIPKLWDKKYRQYDGLKVFLEFVFGPLSCGGVAKSHYGSFKLKGYRHRLRLQKFWQSEFVPSEKIAK